LSLQKQALLLESGLNRLALQAEIQRLHSATWWVSGANRASRGLSPLLLVLAPLAGFLLMRGSRRPNSWLSRLAGAAKWIAPLYRLWKSFSPGREESEPTETAV
jgi:hypothetical protein